MKKITETEQQLAYDACVLRDEGRSVSNVSRILNTTSATIARLTTRIVIHTTAEEAAILMTLIQRDKSVKSLSEFTLKAWQGRIDTEKLRRKKYVRNDDYRQAYLDEFRRCSYYNS